MDRNTMKTVDVAKEFTHFTPSDQHYIKKFEEMNMGRANDMKLLRSRNKRLAFIFGGLVIGIYAYTIFSVKQEKFLDFETDAVKESEKS